MRLRSPSTFHAGNNFLSGRIFFPHLRLFNLCADICRRIVHLTLRAHACQPVLTILAFCRVRHREDGRRRGHERERFQGPARCHNEGQLGAPSSLRWRPSP